MRKWTGNFARSSTGVASVNSGAFLFNPKKEKQPKRTIDTGCVHNWWFWWLQKWFWWFWWLDVATFGVTPTGYPISHFSLCSRFV